MGNDAMTFPPSLYLFFLQHLIRPDPNAVVNENLISECDVEGYYTNPTVHTIGNCFKLIKSVGGSVWWVG